MAKVNYEAMRIKLEFLYRMLNYANAMMIRQYRMREEDTMPTISLIGTVGLNLIWIQRAIPEVVTIEASKKAQGICQMLSDELIAISEKVIKGCEGVSGDELYQRSEEILQAGLDGLMAMIVKILEGKEESHD